MSLYGDVPQAKNATKAAESAGWGAVNKLQPNARKTSLHLAPPPSVLLRSGRGAGRGPPPAGRGRGSILEQAQLRGGSAVSSAVASAATTSAATAASAYPLSVFGEVQDEYEPSRPNDYERVIREREQAARAAEEESERQARLRQLELEEQERQRIIKQIQQQAQQRQQLLKEEAEKKILEFQQRHQQPPPGGSSGGGNGGSSGAGSPPPPPPPSGEAQYQAAVNVSAEEAYLRRAQMSRGGAAVASSSGGAEGFGAPAGGLGFGQYGAGPADEENAPKGMSLAQKLLEKMGWKEGEGLGRNRQGMSTPLMHQKTDKRSGIITNAAEVTKRPATAAPGGGGEAGQPEAKRARMGVALSRPPTRVLCLRNMVGPGEVDGELEDEVGGELTKYGTVQDVVIFEVTEVGYPPEEAVRIFIKFERSESATKAIIDLSGRFFGGREIRVDFFDEDKFERMELAPVAGEFDGK